MVQPTSTDSLNALVVGLKSLDSKPTLNQIGRAPASALSIEDETKNLSALSIARKLLFLENNPKTLAINQANKGLSFVQTADTALDQTVSAITELRALAVQATSEDLSDDEREDLQEKADELIAELNQIASETSFGGKALFDGSLDSFSFEIGEEPSDVLSVIALRADAKGLGLQQGDLQTIGARVALRQDETGNRGVQEGNADTESISRFQIKQDNVALAKSLNIADRQYGGDLKTIRETDRLTDQFDDEYGSGLAKTAIERIEAIRASGSVEFKNIFATAETTFSSSDVSAEDFSGVVDANKSTNIKSGSIDSGDLKINGISVKATAFLDNDGAGTLSKAINALEDKTGVNASVNADGELELLASDGRDIIISTASSDVSNLIFGNGDNRFSEKFSNLRITGRISVTSESDLTLLGGGSATLGLNDFSVAGTQQNKSTDSNISTTSFSSVSGANQAVDSIDSALGQVRNFKRSLQDVGDQFIASIANTDIGIGSRQASRLVSNLSNNLFVRSASVAVSAQANIDSNSTLFFLRS